MKIYFDNASTTPLLPEVKESMIDIINNYFGNPSSIHSYGRQTKSLVEESRKIIAEYFNASTGEIFFTSGATEANNMSLLCSIRDLGVKRIISSPTEHHCILHTLNYIKEQNLAEVEYLNVNKQGEIDLNELEQHLDSSDAKTIVSLMHANNEIGTLHDIAGIAAICKEKGSLFHCDTAQTVGKYSIDLNEVGVSFLSGSAHKFFGPKGVGFIYINNDNLIKPLMHGGDQERGMRSGTENIYGIVGMAKALSIAKSESEDRKEKVSTIKNHFKNSLKDNFSDIGFNGAQDNQLYNVLSVSFPQSSKSEMIMMNLDISGISASGGSACSSGVENDSHVLQAIGHDPRRKTVRFSFSHFNTIEEVDFVIDKLKDIISD